MCPDPPPDPAPREDNITAALQTVNTICGLSLQVPGRGGMGVNEA